MQPHALQRRRSLLYKRFAYSVVELWVTLGRMLNKLISNEQNSRKSVMQSFSPLRITCSVITLGLCLTTASVGVNTAYALPAHNPARQQGVHMQSQTNLRHPSITQELPFVASAEVRAQKHLNTSTKDSADSFEHTLAHMPSSPVSTDGKSVSKPSGKHFASSDVNAVQVDTKSVEQSSDRQSSIQNVGSKDSKDSKESKSTQDSKLAQDVRAQNQMLFADRSAQAPYDVPFNLQYKSFSSEMTYFQKLESGRNYNHGFGAGDSYNALGAYQFDRRYGLDTFMKQVYNYDPQTFYMLSAVGEKYNWDFSTHDVFDKASGTFTQFGDDLNQAWHSAYTASPDVFSRLQDYYAYYNYYAAPDGVKRSLSYFGVNPDERSDSFKSLVWGMANLFGKGGGIYSLRAGNYWGCNKFFKLANIDGSMNDEQLIAAICDAVIDNVKNIYPSQQIYWQGWINRYADEKAHYLSLSIGSWQLDSHGWYYVDSTGRTVKGWFNAVNGKRWYADPSTGYAIFGDCAVRGRHYWIDSNIGLLYNSWVKDAQGNWLRTDGNGCLLTGWYFAPSGKWFYFNQDHKMVIGKLTDDNKDYWLDENAGLLYNNWVKTTDGSWMHTNDKGILATGWYYAPNGRWWYFNKDNYKMVTGKVTYKGDVYWLDENVGLLYNGWVTAADGSRMHTNDKGILATGWYLAPDGKWWYFGNDFKMFTGELNENGHRYWLDPNNGLSCNTWVQDTQGNWFYADQNGRYVTGWYHTPNNKWFYFDLQSNKALFGYINVNNEHFYVDYINGLDLSRSDRPSVETLKNWLLRAASGEIGYEAYKDPQPGSKYGRWMADITDTPWLRGPSSEVWWCAIFVSWCFDQAHVDWDVLPSYNCDQIYDRARNDNKSIILSDVHDCQPGDIVLYNFHGGTSCQHIGIIESNNGSTITTIEGNTSSGEAGSQHAGNGVWRRTRPFTHVRAIIRPYPFV